jgi:N-acetyl-anhydromuramyl-L-alanine amidase AmpD
MNTEIIKQRIQAADKRARREKSWVGIIVHHTGLDGLKDHSVTSLKNFFHALAGFLSRKDNVFASAHYLIGREGEVICLVDPETHESFHAGKSSYYHPLKRAIMPDWNRYAIGIELVGDGNQMHYTDAQYESLAFVYKCLLENFPSIHPACTYLGHEFISPGRKVDPGEKFDWYRLKRLVEGAHHES